MELTDIERIHHYELLNSEKKYIPNTIEHLVYTGKQLTLFYDSKVKGGSDVVTVII